MGQRFSGPGSSSDGSYAEFLPHMGDPAEPPSDFCETISEDGASYELTVSFAMLRNLQSRYRRYRPQGEAGVRGKGEGKEAR